MRLVAGALVALLSLNAAQEQDARAQPPAPERGTIAVLRRDGLMIPFASFRGRTWATQWPVGQVSSRGTTPLERPINLRSIPERWWGGWTPETWQAALKDGTTRELTLLAPQLFRVYCAETIGVRTDYQPAQRPPYPPIDPYPKDGLAVTSGIHVEPINVVSARAPAWASLAVNLLDEFNRAEDKEASVVSSVWSHPIERDERRRIPVQLESWYLTGLDDGATVSYIEAVRRYPPGPDDDECGIETLFSGWVIGQESGGSRWTDLRARITYCDRVGATYMQPFGRIRLGDRVYWIGEVSGRESEWYTVAEISGERVRYVAEYPGGSLRTCR
jgi:hypothetical protein